jgi:hypothetical protein
VAACVIAIDDVSCGLIRPSTEAVRKRMGNDRDATDPDQWNTAIDSFADPFLAVGEARTTAAVAGAARAGIASRIRCVPASSRPTARLMETAMAGYWVMYGSGAGGRSPSKM